MPQSSLVGPDSLLQHPHRFEDRRANSQLLSQFEDVAWLGPRTAKVAAQTGDGEFDPKAMSQTETVDDSPFGVSDAKTEVLAHRHLDAAKSEVACSKDVDVGGWVVDLRAVAPCRNGQLHPGRGFRRSDPNERERSPSRPCPGRSGADHHEVDLVDTGCLS